MFCCNGRSQGQVALWQWCLQVVSELDVRQRCVAALAVLPIFYASLTNTAIVMNITMWYCANVWHPCNLHTCRCSSNIMMIFCGLDPDVNGEARKFQLLQF